jgi:hypothetical protein
MDMSRNAAALLAAADEYARTAANHLWGAQPPNDGKNPSQEPQHNQARLRIHFLFPQLADWQRSLLLTIYWQRRAFLLLIQASRKGLSNSLKSDLERLTNQIEQNFMGLIQSTRDLMASWKLTPLQMELFEFEFVSVPFDMESV